MPEAAAEHPPGGLLARLRLMRLPNALTAAADVAAGGALAGIFPGRLGLTALAAVLLYAGGCVLNDLRDREKDRTKHPHRPLPAGAVSSREAAVLAGALFAAALGTAALAGPAPAAAAGGLLALVLLYDLAAKGRPVAGPAAMGSCRAAAVLLGMSPAFPPHPAALLFPAANLLYVFALTRLALWEPLAPPEQPPAAGIIAPALSAALLLGAGAALLPGFSAGRALPFLALFALAALRGFGHGLRAARPGEVAQGVGILVLAIPLLDAFAAAGAAGWGAGVAAASCALPAWLARRRFYIT